jgi:2-polyprenyl-6-hydroxyphenyl methylase / 3-demethylubiquinone-9 3-methyltransferase
MPRHLPTDKNLTIITNVKGFYDNFWPANLPSREDLEETRKHLEKIIPNQGWDRVLDAGCGLGVCTVSLSDMGSQVVGVDISPESLQAAGRLVKQLGKENVEFREADLMELPFDDESFDLILCWGVLMYVPSAEKVFSELIRCLRKDGTLVVAVHRKSALTPLHDAIRRMCLRIPGFARGAAIKLMALSIKTFVAATSRRAVRDDLSFEAKVEDFYFVPFKRFFTIEEMQALFRRHEMSSEVVFEHTGRFKSTSNVVLRGAMLDTSIVIISYIENLMAPLGI